MQSRSDCRAQHMESGDMALRYISQTPFPTLGNGKAGWKREEKKKKMSLVGELVKSPGLSAKHVKPCCMSLVFNISSNPSFSFRYEV